MFASDDLQLVVILCGAPAPACNDNAGPHHDFIVLTDVVDVERAPDLTMPTRPDARRSRPLGYPIEVQP